MTALVVIEVERCSSAPNAVATAQLSSTPASLKRLALVNAALSGDRSIFDRSAFAAASIALSRTGVNTVTASARSGAVQSHSALSAALAVEPQAESTDTLATASMISAM